jgi:hypothetical protein
MSENCKRCGRPLKTPESKKLGYGKSCFTKVEKNYTQLSYLKEKKNVSS